MHAAAVILDAILVGVTAVLVYTAYCVLVTREPCAASPLTASARARSLASAGMYRFYSATSGANVAQGVYIAQTLADAACTYGDSVLTAAQCQSLHKRADDVTGCTFVAGTGGTCGSTTTYPVRVGLARYLLERMDLAANPSAAAATRLALFRPCMVADGVGADLKASPSWFGSPSPAESYFVSTNDVSTNVNNVANDLRGKSVYSLRYLAPVDAFDTIVATSPGMSCNQFSIVYGPTAVRSGFAASTVPGFSWTKNDDGTLMARTGPARTETQMNRRMTPQFLDAFRSSAVRHIVCCVTADMALACFLCTAGADGRPMCHIEVTTGVPAWTSTVGGLRDAAATIRANTECAVDQPGVTHFLAVPSLYTIARTLGYAF